VIEDLIVQSLESIDGVSLIGPKWSDKLLSLFQSNARPGIGVRVDEEQELILDIAVNVAYGIHIPDIGVKIQDIVKQDVKKVLDIAVKDVNVNIEALQRG